MCPGGCDEASDQQLIRVTCKAGVGEGPCYWGILCGNGSTGILTPETADQEQRKSESCSMLIAGLQNKTKEG